VLFVATSQHSCRVRSADKSAYTDKAIIGQLKVAVKLVYVGSYSVDTTVQIVF